LQQGDELVDGVGTTDVELVEIVEALGDIGSTRRCCSRSSLMRWAMPASS
jgi:hypothetical protein